MSSPEELNPLELQQPATTDQATLAEIQRLYELLITAKTRPADSSLLEPLFGLSHEQVFAYMNLTNHRSLIDDSRFTVPLVRVVCRGIPKEVTERVLRKCKRIWNNNTHIRARRLVAVLVTDALDHVQTALDHYSPPPYVPPVPVQLYTFTDLRMSRSCIPLNGGMAPLTVHCDLAVGRLATDQFQPYPEVLFPIILTKGTQSAEEAWLQLIAFLGIIHNARKEAGVKNTSVYGMCSDGREYCFAQINEDSMACRSATHDIETNLYGTIITLCGILRTIQESCGLKEGGNTSGTSV